MDYKSKRWRELSQRVMRRDGYMCQLSKRYGKRVPADLVHHIYPADEYPEYAYCAWNLVSLSRKMHNMLHDRNTNRLTDEGKALQRRTALPGAPGVSPPRSVIDESTPRGTVKGTLSNSKPNFDKGGSQ